MASTRLLILLGILSFSRALLLPIKTAATLAGAMLSLHPMELPLLPPPTGLSSSSTAWSTRGPSKHFSSPMLSTVLLAKEELPSLERCFNAVRKELGREGESLRRLQEDIDRESYKDIILFTREYDAGFRGGVLKTAWKQMDGEAKRRGIEVSNSFTFDLIALNKAARVADKAEAARCLSLVRQDLVDFLALEGQQDNSR